MDHADKANVILAWTAHPARQNVPKLVAAILVIALIGVAVALAAGHWLAGVLGALLLVASMQRFFLPSRFAIDEEGLTANFALTHKRVKWSDVRRFACDPAGGYLATRAVPNWTDAYRGLHLVFGEGDIRTQAIDAIRARLACAGSAAQPSSPPASSQQQTAQRHPAGAPV